LTSNGGGQGGKTGLYFINKPRFDKYKASNIVETLKVGGDTPLMRIKNGTKKGYDEATIGDGINLAFPNSKTRRGRVGKKVSQILDTHCNMGTIDDHFRIRRLTPTECFRLQGFPDAMVQQARELGISDSQLYKMAGNAVTVNVAQAVAQKIWEVEYGT
jgi:DNA (cytosine-5)-methyltransferase 1